jgi:hypothetical protein
MGDAEAKQGRLSGAGTDGVPLPLFTLPPSSKSGTVPARGF